MPWSDNVYSQHIFGLIAMPQREKKGTALHSHIFATHFLTARSLLSPFPTTPFSPPRKKVHHTRKAWWANCVLCYLSRIVIVVVSLLPLQLLLLSQVCCPITRLASAIILSVQEEENSSGGVVGGKLHCLWTVFPRDILPMRWNVLCARSKRGEIRKETE